MMKLMTTLLFMFSFASADGRVDPYDDFLSKLEVDVHTLKLLVEENL